MRLRHGAIAAALIVFGASAAFAKWGKSDSSSAELAIRRQLTLYADSLDWPRGSDWPIPAAASFDPADDTTWPEAWAAGTKQFFDIFTDDVVIDYPHFHHQFRGKENTAPVRDGTTLVGGIGYMFNAWSMASQTNSHTVLSNILITVDGDEATSKDRFSHVGYLTGGGQTWADASHTMGFHEGKWRKEDGVWRCYYWHGTVQFNSTD
ncbi:MAG: nuclear transport factor 2 family protein [Deltaproteobacteria bacterium]|nr:nuclear transport factor 2 family protein [Deltaproteobacteria bacterium]MBW2361352.1 nuclear transport factor 2 family protein [Deltaproteobacteria bacterium]